MFNKKINRNLIYIIGLLVLSAMFVLNLKKSIMLETTLRDKNYINVRVTKVNCYSHGNKSYIVFQTKGSNHIVRVADETCLEYKAGDSLNVLYNRDYDLYFPDTIDTVKEKLAMMIFGFFFIIILISFLFPNLLKSK